MIDTQPVNRFDIFGINKGKLKLDRARAKAVYSKMLKIKKVQGWVEIDSGLVDWANTRINFSKNLITRYLMWICLLRVSMLYSPGKSENMVKKFI